ncbi:MAG TPA: hypothetical protein VN918_10380, partial [Myxococcaceae bacterium]|nr:hypothetical protein [Myxococcaceae bacterium]
MSGIPTILECAVNAMLVYITDDVFRKYTACHRCTQPRPSLTGIIVIQLAAAALPGNLHEIDARFAA